MKRRDFIRNCAIGSAAVAAPWSISGETSRTGISFLDYVRHMEPNLVEGWHHKAISDAVIPHRKLVVCGPPMMGKSMLFSKYLPAYYLGHNPNHNAICISVTEEVAALRREAFEDTVESRRHRGIFPEPIAGNVLFGGLGGSFGGREADIVVFDDVTYSQSLAFSQKDVARFDHVSQGLNDSGCLYVTGTRLSQNDLYSELMRRGFDVLNIRAASNKGRIWPYEDSRKLGWMKQLPYDKMMAQYYQTP